MKFRKSVLLWQLFCCFLLLLALLAMKKMDLSIAKQTMAFLDQCMSIDHTVSEVMAKSTEAMKKGVDSAEKMVTEGETFAWESPVDMQGVTEAWNDEKKQMIYESEGEMQVYAASGGTVLSCEKESRGAYTLKIEHGKNSVSVYWGCTDVYVKPLEKVRKGAIIGSVESGKENRLVFQILENGEQIEKDLYPQSRKE